MFTLAVRTSNHRLGLLQCLHWQSDPLTNRLDLMPNNIMRKHIAIVRMSTSPFLITETSVGSY